MAVNVESAQKMVEQPIEKLSNLSPSVYFGAMTGSVVLSLALFLMGRRQWGIFVGLWAPTILNMGLFNKILKPSNNP